MDRTTGAVISGDEYDAQCVDDLLTTPLGTRVMLLDYGWAGTEIMDAPLNKTTGLLLIAAAVMAIRRWIPRLTVTGGALSGDLASGAATLTIMRTSSTAASGATSQTIPLAS
jgi:phage baseplate assembly protein W